jgi:hypothetical protein
MYELIGPIVYLGLGFGILAGLAWTGVLQQRSRDRRK